jgi:tRNA 2-thiouridine synthesizing protein A
MESMKGQENETLDVLGRVCPYPLVLTKKAMEKLASGQILKVKCDAPASAEESIPKFCEKQGYALQVEKVGDGAWELYIKKP